MRDERSFLGGKRRLVSYDVPLLLLVVVLLLLLLLLLGVQGDRVCTVVAVIAVIALPPVITATH